MPCSLVVMLTLGSFQLAAACDEPIQVTVVAILASTDGKGHIDGRVKEIAQQVQKNRPELKSFRVGSTSKQSVKAKQKITVPVAENENAEVTVEHAANANNKVGLTVKAPQCGKITYTTCCGKFFPIVTSYKTKDGQLLIIAIMVQPCP